LLEGLEAAEIRWSVLNEELRYEAEFFQKKYLLEDSELSVLSKTTIGAFAAVTDGPHGYHIVDENSPIAMLTAKCAKDWFSDRTPAETIAASVDLANKRSSLAENDIILSTRGTVGMCALVTKEALPANIDQDVARISWVDKESIRPEFVIAYLNSKFGQDRIKRYASGMVQQGLSLQKVRDIPIPLLSNALQKAVALVVQMALKCRRDAEISIGTAETTLLRTLGLENWRAPEPLSYVRNSLDAFEAGRLDAEHFQPKYKALIDAMSGAGKDFQLVPLGKISAPLKYGCSDKLEYVHQGRVFLRIADLENKRFNPNSVLHIPADTVFAESDLVENGDVLISRSGTLGVAVPITDEFSGSAYGSYFIRSRPDINVVHPEFLALFINSLAGQMQVEQKNTGGIQTNLTIPAIESLLIPIGSINWQMPFVEMVYLSLFQRQRATQLLDAARRAVEIAIEDSEAAALAYLEGVNP
jgi:hypothetical protein